jgi:cytoskeletal protein CcmA (bactofilin family)
VNPVWATLLLVLATGTLFLLPLVPTLREFYAKTDAGALSVIQQHTGDVRYFADSFRAYVRSLDKTLDDCKASGRPATGVMPDGTDYLVLGSGDQAYQLPFSGNDQQCPVLVAAASDLLLPSDSIFSKDIYSRGRLEGGANNSYRAILAEQAAHLGEKSTVQRWVHSVAELSAAQDCKLYGRASSESVVRLAVGCMFTRVNAPKIAAGEQAEVELDSGKEGRSTWDVSTRILHEGDLEIAAQESFQGNLVVRGKLHIGAGARVYGNVKSERDAVLGTGARVEGSLISARNLILGPECKVHGPVIAEHEMWIGRDSRFGAANCPTTVSAPRITISGGAVIFGTLWARERGEVADRS